MDSCWVSFTITLAWTTLRFASTWTISVPDNTVNEPEFWRNLNEPELWLLREPERIERFALKGAFVLVLVLGRNADFQNQLIGPRPVTAE